MAKTTIDYPFFPLFLDLVDSDAMVAMNAAERWAVIAMLRDSWTRPEPGKLPNNDAILAKISELGPKWSRSRAAVLSVFQVDGDQIVYPPLVEHWEKVVRERSAKAMAGSAGAKAKWLNRDKEPPPNDGKRMAVPMAVPSKNDGRRMAVPIANVVKNDGGANGGAILLSEESEAESEEMKKLNSSEEAGNTGSPEACAQSQAAGFPSSQERISSPSSLSVSPERPQTQAEAMRASMHRHFGETPCDRQTVRKQFVVACSAIFCRTDDTQRQSDLTSAHVLFDQTVWPSELADETCGRIRARSATKIAQRPGVDQKRSPMGYITEVIRRELGEAPL